MYAGRDWLPVSSLKGIGVYCENDLHDLALLMLNVRYARAAIEGTNSIPWPTLNGLARQFAELINNCYPDYGPVFAVIEKHGLPPAAVLELDDRIGVMRTSRKDGPPLVGPASDGCSEKTEHAASECRRSDPNPDFTELQGRYLAFIHHYTKVNKRPPAEADIHRYFRVLPPTAHQMIVRLERKGLIARTPGQARSIKVLVPLGQLPPLE